MHSNAFSFAANQAALASLKSSSAGVYSERRFLLQELNLYSATAVLPTHSGNFGFKGDYLGGPSFNESQFGLAYGRKLGTKVDVGVQFNYYSIKILGYGSTSSICPEAGVIFHLTDEISTGIHIYNPTGVSLGKNSEEKLPYIYSAGFGYDASDKFFIGAEIEKVEDQEVNVHAGLQYYFDEKLFAAGGISSATSSYYLSFGVLLKDIQISATASVHPNLGVTPGLLVIFNHKKEK